MRPKTMRIPAHAIPARAADWDEIVDFLKDFVELLTLFVEFLRNLGQYLSGE